MAKKYIFKKTHEVDKDKFAELLVAAKGGRTMKDFAELCGANPSTFTRIVQKANKGASSPELIEAIAQHAAPKSGVTIESLADANGYTLEQDIGLTITKLTVHPENMERVIRTTVYQELLERGQEVSLGGIRYNVSKRMMLSPDALIMTDAFGRKSEEEKGLWFVDSVIFHKEKHRSQGAYESNVRHRAFSSLSRFAFISMNASDFLKPTRFSLVVTDKEVYDIIIDEFGETVFPVDMTLILLDTFNSRIVDEFMFPLKGAEQRESFFMTVSPTNYDSEYIITDTIDDEEDDE